MKRIIAVLAHSFIGMFMIAIGAWNTDSSLSDMGVLEYIFLFTFVINLMLFLYEPIHEFLAVIKLSKQSFKNKKELIQQKHNKKLASFVLTEEEKEALERYFKEKKEEQVIEEPIIEENTEERIEGE